MDVGAEPYTCVVSPDGKTVYVSVWGGAKVLAFDAATLEKRGEIAVGEHPNAMVVLEGRRAAVRRVREHQHACGSSTSPSKTAKEQISMALFPNAPPGATPNGLGLSPDGTTPARRQRRQQHGGGGRRQPTRRGAWSSGFIPTGWYPTAAQFSKDGSRIFVLSGKGLTSQANPRGTQPGHPGHGDEQYSGAHAAGLALDPARRPTPRRCRR